MHFKHALFLYIRIVCVVNCLAVLQCFGDDALYYIYTRRDLTNDELTSCELIQRTRIYTLQDTSAPAVQNNFIRYIHPAMAA